jgi:immune inhibitor A
MLILLAEFGEDEEAYGEEYVGPLHNAIPRPETQEAADAEFWVDDFSREHYQDMLFTEGGYDATDFKGEIMHLDSMIDYYLEMSNGSYIVDGDVYGWYKLPHSEAYYGDDEGGGHDNKLPGIPSNLVSDLLKEAYLSGDIDFEEYDREDTMDLDGDGILNEPDGIIDHLVIVHAGIDQSGGGGEQGDNAIWAHSSSVFDVVPVDGMDEDLAWEDSEGDVGILAYNYIIQGENGTIGVFCHEYGHDLQLPDEYDTIYSGDGEPVGFYSLMSSGSWAGKPLGTKPTPISPWGRWQLGQIWGGIWVQPTEVDYEDITKDGMTFKLDETTNLGNNNQVIKVNLPQKMKTLTSPYEGEYSFFGGKGDQIDNTLTVAESVYLPEASAISLDFMTWYNIEENWDFGFVQISTDGGETWASLESGRTTDALTSDGYPAIKDNLPGYTGRSDGWINEVIDLSEYAGQEIQLQFRYMTDWGTSLEGMFVDNIKLYADGAVLFEDDAENGDTKWVNSGWSASLGYELKSHYYLLEWRNYNNTDEALQYGYNWNGDIVEFYKHNTGMLVWYRDTAYDDNWVGEHPGHGFLGIVDSHSEPMVAKGYSIRTRIQIHDASFSLDRGEDKLLTFYEKSKIVQSKQAVPEFNDSQSYWNKKAPSSGVKVPKYGLKFRVIGNSPDNTVGEIAIYK